MKIDGSQKIVGQWLETEKYFPSANTRIIFFHPLNGRYIQQQPLHLLL